MEGRAIHYHIADDLGNVDDGAEGHSLTFNGSNLEELAQKLQEETGLDDIIICTRSPINGKLTPLRLQLPPNNAAMHIVLVQESSKGEITTPCFHHFGLFLLQIALALRTEDSCNHFGLMEPDFHLASCRSTITCIGF